MSKKKKGIITFIIFTFILGITSLTVNAEEDDVELEICSTEVRTYYFVHNAHYNPKTIQNMTPTTTFEDELPDNAEQAVTRVESYGPMSLSDFQSYINLISTGDCTISQTGAPMCKQGDLRSNSGTEGAGYSGFPDIMNGSMSVSEYWDTRIVLPSSVNVQCGNSVNGLVTCSINRVWDPTNFSGEKYSVPAVARIRIEYQAEDCGSHDEVPPPEVCTETESKNVPGALSCQNGVYEEVAREEVTANRTIVAGEVDHSYYTTYKQDKGTCTTDLSEKIMGTSIIKQTGTASFPFSPNTIYSGGGFNFSANYSSKAIYNICTPLEYQVTEQIPTYTCPAKDSVESEYNNGMMTVKEKLNYGTGNLNKSNKTCTYNETKEVTFVFQKNDYEMFPENYTNGICYNSSIMGSYNGDENLMACNATYTSGTVNGMPANLFSVGAYNANSDYYNRICNGINMHPEDPNLMWCSPNTQSRTVTENAVQNGCESKTTNYSCSQTATKKGYDCSDTSKEMEAYAKKMAEYLQDPNIEETAKIMTKDSNKVDGNYTTTDKKMDGVWQSSSISNSSWYPNKYVSYNSTFYLGKACISVYPDNITKAPITYVGNGTCDSNATIDGGNLYYVPLKWPDGKRFPVSVTIDELSIITVMDWNLDYKCGIDCYQKLYENNGTFKFIYRPIDLANPFPGRSWGSNWNVFMGDDSAKRDKLSRNSLEYSVNLTPALISTIKGYNSYSYSNLRSVTKDGSSLALRQFGIYNKISNNYNELGKCLVTGNSKCWVNGEEPGVW